MKRLLALCLSLGLLCVLMIPTANAAEVSASSIRLTYALSLDEAHTQSVSRGDTVDVTFRMLRTDAAEDYNLGVFQNEIVYDQSFFRYVEGSARSARDRSFDVIFDTRTNNDHIIKATALSGRGYEADMEVCSFQLEVIGTSGSGWVSSSRAKAYDAEGNAIAITPADLTVSIGGGSTEPPEHTHDYATAWSSDISGHWHTCTGEDCDAVSGLAAHTAGDWQVVTAATATTAGTRTRSCTVCGYVMETETIPATGTPTTPDVTPTVPTMPDFTPPTGGGTTATPPATITDDPTPLDPGTTITDDETPLSGMPFEDVLPGDWFYAAVQYVYDKGLMNGVSETRFGPQLSTERAMIVTILYRMETEPDADVSTFTDVEAGQWYTEAVNWGAANEVVKGYSETSFRPAKAITREEMAAILYRYAQLKGYDTAKRDDLIAFTDAGDVSDYAEEAMQWAVAEGLLTGVTETTLVPQGTATRAQMAMILMRFCENIAA